MVQRQSARGPRGSSESVNTVLALTSLGVVYDLDLDDEKHLQHTLTWRSSVPR